MVLGIFRMALPSRRNDAICLLGLRHRHIFMWQSLQILNIFKALTLKQVFVKPFFEKLEYHCLVESTTIESALLLWKTSFSKASVNPLSKKLTKWPNTLKQFVGNLPTNCLNVFGHFIGLAIKGLNSSSSKPSSTVTMNRKTLIFSNHFKLSQRNQCKKFHIFYLFRIFSSLDEIRRLPGNFWI